MSTVTPAWYDYVDRVNELDDLFTTAVAYASDAGFNAGDWFNNGTSGSQSDYQLVVLKTTGGSGPGQRPQNEGPQQGPQLPPGLAKPPTVPAISHASVGGQVIANRDGSVEFLSNSADLLILKAKQNEIIPPDMKNAPELQEYLTLQQWMDGELSKLCTPSDIPFVLDSSFGPLHYVLDFLGLFPLVGEVPDGVNGVLYTIEGNKTDAGLSFGAMIPFYGMLGTFGKWGKRVFHAADTGADAGSAGYKAAKEIIEGGYLKYNSKGGWISNRGLFYSARGSEHGNRVKHIFSHLEDIGDPTHTVFNVKRNELLPLIDEAWAMRKKSVPSGSGADVFEINMGRVIGTKGEKRICIIVESTPDGKLHSIVTAFPIK